MDRNEIRITNATENNLKSVSLSIPKYKITVFTGASGSGKSSLALDTIAAQSRRELNDTFPTFVQNYLPKYGRPHVQAIENMPVAIVIDQKKPTPNVRSTVGTYTDTYALLRLLFSRVGQPFVGYSDTFSFNHPQGCCPNCDGIGEVTELDVHKLVDFDKCLNDPGVINYVAFEPGQWRWIRYANSGLFDLDKKIRDYSEEELELFLNSPQIKLKDPPKGWPKTAKYEGLVHRMYRSVLNSEEGKLHRDYLDDMTRRVKCPLCKGARLSEKTLSCKINGKNIADVAAMPLPELEKWLLSIESPIAVDIQKTLSTRIHALIDIGLEYLSLDRPLGSLSGGEAQRCKIAKYLNSSLSDMMYILDEPSVGLHSRDIDRMLRAVRKLRDAGNTVLLVEHHREMIAAADHIVDMGPGAGGAGGEILFEGSYEELLLSDTPTALALREETKLKTSFRDSKDWCRLEDVNHHNLKNISVDLPLGVCCVICGVAGSGKSSLMEYFDANYHKLVGNVQDKDGKTGNDVDDNHEGNKNGHQNMKYARPVYVMQKSIGSSLRSTPATYLGVADLIRKVFAKRSGKKANLFSFNGEGKCPVCKGKGVVVSEMSFMDHIESQCEACHGLRYNDEVLSYKVDGYSIAQVMDFSVEEAEKWFDGTEIAELLHPLTRVGLSYIHLNQALSTLSGGELQRMKLASCLGETGQIFILDEPTDGLHLQDIKSLLKLFDELVEDGNSLFVVEHSLDVIRQADYVIEIGPAGGEKGGEILFAGTLDQMKKEENSVTRKYL